MVTADGMAYSNSAAGVKGHKSAIVGGDINSLVASILCPLDSREVGAEQLKVQQVLPAPEGLGGQRIGSGRW